jgi:murein DD-endopeptidase MepM/ murein hydrolase activator NlpD
MIIAVVIIGSAIAGAAAAAVAVSSKKQAAGGGNEGGSKSPVPAVLPPGVEPPKNIGVPFAMGLARPLWPVRTKHSRRYQTSYRGEDGKTRGNHSRRFGSVRDGGARNHAGVDLYCYAGDAVLAMSSGQILAVQSFHLGSWSVFVDHGPFVVMYGEVKKSSWSAAGLAVGDTVVAGQKIAEVACMVQNEDGCTSHMLHLETYKSGTTRNYSWKSGGAAPESLLDPSLVLLLAAANSTANVA